MRKNSEDNNFNQKVATIVTNATGNMWFFWLSLAFIVVLRISTPPTTSQFLLDIENDLQLLLLAANAVVANKQTKALRKSLNHLDHQADRIEYMDKTEENILEDNKRMN